MQTHVTLWPLGLLFINKKATNFMKLLLKLFFKYCLIDAWFHQSRANEGFTLTIELPFVLLNFSVALPNCIISLIKVKLIGSNGPLKIYISFSTLLLHNQNIFCLK